MGKDLVSEAASDKRYAFLKDSGVDKNEGWICPYLARVVGISGPL